VISLNALSICGPCPITSPIKKRVKLCLLSGATTWALREMLTQKNRRRKNGVCFIALRFAPKDIKIVKSTLQGFVRHRGSCECSNGNCHWRALYCLENSFGDIMHSNSQCIIAFPTSRLHLEVPPRSCQNIFLPYDCRGHHGKTRRAERLLRLCFPLTNGRNPHPSPLKHFRNP